MFDEYTDEQLIIRLKYLETQMERYNLVKLYYEELKKEVEKRKNAGFNKSINKRPNM